MLVDINRMHSAYEYYLDNYISKLFKVDGVDRAAGGPTSALDRLPQDRAPV